MDEKTTNDQKPSEAPRKPATEAHVENVYELIAAALECGWSAGHSSARDRDAVIKYVAVVNGLF